MAIMSAPELSPRMLSERIVAIVPPDVVDLPIAPVEVMVQEGIGVVSLPVDMLPRLSTLRQIFSTRAEFGVHGVRTLDELNGAVQAAAGFVIARIPDERLVRTAVEAGMPVLVPALTPTEVLRAFDMGATAVVVTPADAFGGSYPQQLAELAPDVPVLPMGSVGAYAAERWLEAGAVGVCLDETLTGAAFTGGSLEPLRERCQTFVKAVRDAG